MAKRSAKDAAVVRLPADLDLTAATPLAQEFLAVRGRDVDVDGSETRRIGGQCLQVLLSAEATWAADGAAFRLSAASPELQAQLLLLGVPEGSRLCVQETTP
jgi:chemotaxis protein CheX